MFHRCVSMRGVSLIELVFVVGIAGVLVAIVIPVLGVARVRSQELGSAAHLRECAVVVMGYAAGSQDLPPALLAPVYTPDVWAEQWATGARGCRVHGHWFANAALWQYAMEEAVPAEVLVDPRQPRENLALDPARCEPTQSDYELTQTLYAASEYFDRGTQRGPSQWGVQRIGDIRYPSGKVLMFQAYVWSSEATLPGISTFDWERKPRSAVLWGDMSAETLRPMELRAGVPNRWRVMPTPPPPGESGEPIQTTQDGILGLDR